MRFAVHHRPTDPELLVAVARHAEACGFEGFYVPDHLTMESVPFLDPLDALTFVAASTDRVLLGTGVLLLPYRHPVILAKRLATIDVLSRGRMRLLTIGIGNIPAEAAAVGVDFSSRGRRADEAIDVLRLLWTGGPVSFDGEFFAFKDLTSFPAPLAMLPIHVGGASRAAARRAASRGDGWFPGGMLPPEERALQRDLAGRPEYTRWGSPDLTKDQVEALAEEGVTRLVIPAGDDLDELTRFAERMRMS
ncbi:TIGR03619 family F420-dependent LLM class oxidoreductase [Dactylosporangium sp. NPDC005572]|uniref:TIGR03619 family F420-dependent LLM class oxidoreductase n=1 Tax=Dactylosporangium sp. NPDC005572 TaxID=3156889 RepID=UPI0033BF8501